MEPWRARFPATPESAYAIRGELAAIARGCGMSDQAVGDVKLAVSEAVTNVIRHAYDDDDVGDIAATASTGEGALHIVISDDGRGVAPRADSPGVGLGFPLIASLTQTMELVNREGGGTELRMTFPI